MSNDIVRAAQKAIVKSEGTSVVPAVGGALAVVGGGTLAVSTLAFFLPGGIFLWAIILTVVGLTALLKG